MVNRSPNEHVEVQEFERKIGDNIPVLFYSPYKIPEYVLGRISEIYEGVVLETDHFDGKNSDWRIRSLFDHCMIKKRTLKIISLVYEPVSENVYQFAIKHLSSEDSSQIPSVEALTDFTDQFLQTGDHERGIRWFDEKVKPVFMIDVYEHPFPENGINLFSKDNITILLIKKVDDHQKMVQNILAFLYGSTANLPANDTTTQMEKGRLTDVISDSIVLPYEYLRKICDSRYFSHFFAEKNKEEIFRKWCDFNQPHPEDVIKNTIIHINLPLPNIIRHDLNKFRFWFVDIPRTSSSSIKVELGSKFGVAYGKNKLMEKNQAQFNVISNHIPAKIMRVQVGERLWDSLFKFSLTRNPWDRVVSVYNYRKKINSIPPEMHFRDYIKELAKSRGIGLFKYHGFYFSNADYVFDDNNRILVDYLGKFETREEDLKKIAGKLDFPQLGQIHLQSGKTDILHYSQFYDDETKMKVREIYSRDIELFNYTFEENN